MGRTTKLHKTLIHDKERPYFLKKPEVQETMAVLTKLTNSMLKSKGARREMYRLQLQNAHERLAVQWMIKKTLVRREALLEKRLDKLTKEK
jgi:DNA-binding transcriptional regulator YbjK